MCNDVKTICRLLKSYGILTVVDSVSAMFGEELNVDDYQIDFLCGGSQKAISAPPGLTLVTISDDVKKSMKARNTPIRSFYANLMVFEDYYEKKWFPYTMPISDIYGLRQALINISEEPTIVNRHQRIAKAVRSAITKCGLFLYQKDGYSGTVTVFQVPEGIKSQDILNKMKQEHNIMLAGSFDVLENQVIRIGHMGENCRYENVRRTLSALNDVLQSLGVSLNENPAEIFEREY